ncbi:MAG: FliO/MopB family protein [Acidimicrobiales bacterium]
MRDFLAVTSVSSSSNSVSATSLMFQLLVGLAVVLALIWLASKVAKGRFASSARSKRPNAGMTVLNRQTLGKGVHVAIVRAGSETLLLGVTAHQVTRLAELSSDVVELAEVEQAGMAVDQDYSRAERAWSSARLRQTFQQLQELTIRRA